MAIELTGPTNCAECGTECTLETALNGDTSGYTITVKGHRIGIPGLSVCTPCAGAIMVGEKEATVTLEAAKAFLDDIWGPKMVMAVLTLPDDIAELAAGKAVDAAELSALLEALIVLQGEPGGLDFLPECTGNCGEDCEPLSPRDMAAMN